MIDLLASLNVVEAWNEVSWEDAIPFMLTIIFLYWVKVKIDTRAGMGRKKQRQMKKLMIEALHEWESEVEYLGKEGHEWKDGKWVPKP